jgi:hexulose-6-phosphate isomerase
LAGLGSGLFMETHYASPEPVARARARELTLRMLDDAAAGGVEAIMVIPAVVGRATEPRPRVGYEDAYQRTFEALCELRLEAEARAVTIGLENAWNRFLLSPLEVAGLLDEIGSPHVGWHLDVGNILPYGYPEDWIAVLGRRIVRVHAKDYDLSKVGPAGFCALGEGSVNWPAVLAALRAAGYAGPLTYEGDVSGTDVSRRLRALLAGDFAVGQEGPA